MKKDANRAHRTLPENDFIDVYFLPITHDEVITHKFHPLFLLDGNSEQELWAGFVHENNGVYYEEFWLNTGED